jgi:hypothetical protein
MQITIETELDADSCKSATLEAANNGETNPCVWVDITTGQCTAGNKHMCPSDDHRVLLEIEDTDAYAPWRGSDTDDLPDELWVMTDEYLDLLKEAISQ